MWFRGRLPGSGWCSGLLPLCCLGPQWVCSRGGWTVSDGGVVGYVGLMGSGKTMRLVQDGFEAFEQDREVHSNILIGRRFDGVQVPCCDSVRQTHSVPHDRALVLEVVSPELEARYAGAGWRRGRGLVPSCRINYLRSWDDLIRLRVFRDVFGNPHHRSCSIVGCGGSYRDRWGNPYCSRGITVLLDELNLWAPSRLWAKLGVGVLNRWAYGRKDGLDIRWTAQHESRVDKVAREVTCFIWVCKSIGPVRPLFFLSFLPLVGSWFSSFKLHWFFRRMFVPTVLTDSNRNTVETIEKGGALDVELVRFRMKYAEAYDTFEHVAVSAHLIDDADSPPSRVPRRGRAEDRLRSGGGEGVEGPSLVVVGGEKGG